jgi:hypothetical protein
MQPQQAAATSYAIHPDLYRVKLMRGVYSRVARKLGLSESGRSHVLRVANGERRSPRVESALKAEYRRIDRLVLAYHARNERTQELERAA